MAVPLKRTDPREKEPATPDRGTVLIVEDDVLQARALERALSRHFTPRVAHSRAAGLSELSAIEGLRAAVIDVKLGDGSGLDVAEEARRTKPRLPIFVITGYLKPEVVNRVFDLKGRFLAKPLEVKDLESMTDSILRDPSAGIGERLRLLAAEKRLTSRETDVLALALSGLSRRRMAEALGLSLNTVKTRAKRLLKKCGAGSIAEVVFGLLSAEPFPVAPEGNARPRLESGTVRKPDSGRRRSSRSPRPEIENTSARVLDSDPASNT